MSFITVNVLQSLPMHNLNRDQNGLPKSQYDGGVQRARLSSQALKRSARILFREAVANIDNAPASVRTMDTTAVNEVVKLAVSLAAGQGKVLDEVAAKKAASSVVKSLAKKSKDESDNTDKPTADKKDNILLFSDAEFETLGQALVDAQHGGNEPDDNDFIQDFTSPSLDIAAFGRMFAARSDLSTQAAVAVSHAVTTHPAKFTIDYFTALDERRGDREDAGASHLGLAFFTSGVYYRTFTVDSDQLRRSWSGFGGVTARPQVEALVESLIKALPNGRLTNSNAATVPYIVYGEVQKSRVAYEFETPVAAGSDGGYKKSSAKALAAQIGLARRFSPDNVLDSVVQGETYGVDFPGQVAASVHDVARFVADAVFQEQA